MRIFVFEFLFYLMSVFAILVCISSTALFLITYRFEKKLRTVWRALGFLFTGIAFLFFLLERKYDEVDIITVIAFSLLAVGLYCIFYGIRLEPLLAHLANVKGGENMKTAKFKLSNEISEPKNRNLLVIVTSFLLTVLAVSIVLTLFNLTTYIVLVLIALSLIFTIGTLVFQIKRYYARKSIKKARILNLYPILSFICIALWLIGLFFSRLPESDLLFFRRMTLDYSWLWITIVCIVFLAFIFLALWVWYFIKIRKLLRLFVTFLSIIILVASISALIFNLFLFKVVEQNNLDLMERGAETKELIMTDRSNISMLVAGLISKDVAITSSLGGEAYESLLENTTDYLDKTNIDRIRIYNTQGEILVSPNDERDRGRVIEDDNLLAFVVKEKSPVKSFDIDKTVLTDTVISRSLYPIVIDNEVKGVVETAYVFDNAFTDYVKSQTGLDVTFFSKDKRSATTIHTLDNVSRWVGSNETNKDVLEKVLKNGESLKVDTERLGVIYYTSYKPIKDVNGEVIGMVAVGVPTNILFEDARQQLLSVFLIIILISLLFAALGAYVLYRKQNGNK